MKIRNRIFIVFILIIGTGMFALTRWLSADLKSRYNEAVEEPMVDIAHILADSIGSQLLLGEITSDDLQRAFDKSYSRRFIAKIFELEKNQVDMQVYVTDAVGIVVFDSLNSANIGRDYSAWNDVARTLAGEYGARSSSPGGLKNDKNPDQATAFVAAPIIQAEEIVGVVSVGKPKRNIKRFLDLARRNQWYAAMIALISTLLLGFMVYRWVSRPLVRLADFANRVSRGERIHAPNLGNNEIGDVGRAVQSMREALEGKEYTERYVQALTHELKSPLSAIRGAAELLNEDIPMEQREQFLQNIQAESTRMEDLVERMLQLASLEKRRSLEDVEEIDICALLKTIEQEYQAEIIKKDIDLQLELKLEVMIRGEKFLIRQALANLLQNAIDFSPRSVTIQLQCEAIGDSVEISIIDSGPGVPSYAKERIFERFYSLPRPGSEHKSTGLGLNFVMEVVELHGGGMSIDRIDETTKARIRLPV
ncbi:MAG: two-component system sensor histidine kinase CreC [Gammaproteobacteria bacterium]|nr:two-component system sensor histidine kinase CreC [Gammaproteobacteria bacterium]